MFGPPVVLSDGVCVAMSEVVAVAPVDPRFGRVRGDAALYRRGYRTWLILRVGKVATRAPLDEASAAFAASRTP